VTNEDRYEGLRRKLAAHLGDSLDGEVQKIVKDYEDRGFDPAEARERAYGIAADALEDLKRHLLSKRPPKKTP
jgi:DNA primase